MLRNLSTGTEASATGESLNSGDVAVHPAARHNSLVSISSTWLYIMTSRCFANSVETRRRYTRNGADRVDGRHE